MLHKESAERTVDATQGIRGKVQLMLHKESAERTVDATQRISGTYS